MRQSSSTGFSGSIRVRRVHFEAWAFAAFFALPTGCLETSSAVIALQSDLSPVAPFARRALASDAQPTARALHNPPGPNADQALPSFFSDEYWRALADLDLVVSRTVARGEPEVAFTEAVASLAAGNYEHAENAFLAMSTQTTDLPVAAASQAMLATTLMQQHRWEALRDLLVTLPILSVDQPIVLELALWGKAFAGVDPQVIRFPREPVSLRLGVSALGTPSIRVRINSKEYEFWLDTGSTLTVLSSSVAADAGIEALAGEPLRIGTFTGSAPVRPAVLKRMEIGPIVITNTPAMIMDASLLRVRGSSAEGVPWAALSIDGIIGWDIIQHLAISMDFASGTIVLQQPENLGIRGTNAQNLVWVGKPFVQVRTALGDTVQFALDTGAQSTFVNDAVVKKVRAPTSIPGARVFGIAATGGQLVRLVPRLRLEVGGRSLLMRDLIVFTRPPSGLVESDGILGSNIGRFGTVTIDATNGVFSVGG